ncbi:MAG: protein kinase domain-containing protein [Deltaproteobacteria bacterium]
MMPERIGKYAVLRRIASGGMAEVYLCRLTGEEGFVKKVAVKVIHPRLSGDRRFRELFIREARIAASLVHPNLVQVFDFGKAGDSHFLAMEYIDGWNLAQTISQARLCNACIPLPVWRFWMEGVLAGIGHLHSRGIVHRDISPSNVLLSRGGIVKITDFGIARGVLRNEEDKTGWEGKFAYMSPEHARGEEINEGSDLFAAAIVSAEILLLRRLIDEGSSEKTVQRLLRYDVQPPDLEGLPDAAAVVVRKGLSPSREGRYTNADEFSRAVCSAVPFSAGRAELESFWNTLFPGSLEEEDTVVASQFSGSGPNVLRERREGYGIRGRQFVKAGALAALAVLSIGGWAVWKKAGPTTSSPAPTPSPSVDNPLEPPATSVSVPLEKETGALSSSPESRTGSSGKTASVVAGETLPKAVRIETDPVGVAVQLDDGTPLGKTPVSMDVAPWAGRKIIFRREGYAEKAIPADVLVRFQTFRLEMDRLMGAMELIQAIPWAKVYDGDRYIGVTPIRNLKLPVGAHRLRFVNEPLGVERVQEIDVHAGTNPKIIVSLVGEKTSD